MRRGNQDAAIFIGEDGVFNGVSLGWDFTAEHEWGIKGINCDYGLRKVSRGGVISGILGLDVVGIEARRVRQIPDSLELLTFGDATYLISRRRYNNDKLTKKDINRMMEIWSQDANEIQGAWDEGSFGVQVVGERRQKYLQELMDAFKTNDVIITRGNAEPTNPFSGSGLMLLIASRLPQSYIDAQAEADIDRLDLVDAAHATGIANRLEDAGKRYFALSPKWAGEIKSTKRGKIETDYPVLFWLNPMEQRENNSGWFTVEILDEWIAGEGVIIKEQSNG